MKIPMPKTRKERKTMSNDELKPCPFCGGKADVMSNKNEVARLHPMFGEMTRGYATWYKVFCTQCGATGCVAELPYNCEMNTFWQKEAKREAISLWNRRVESEVKNDAEIH